MVLSARADAATLRDASHAVDLRISEAGNAMRAQLSLGGQGALYAKISLYREALPDLFQGLVVDEFRCIKVDETARGFARMFSDRIGSSRVVLSQKKTTRILRHNPDLRRYVGFRSPSPTSRPTLR
jgi:hypothetical protein